MVSAATCTQVDARTPMAARASQRWARAANSPADGTIGATWSMLPRKPSASIVDKPHRDSKAFQNKAT